MSNSNLRIKIVFESEIRVLKMDTKNLNLNTIKEFIFKAFELDLFLMKYKDDENDFITITNIEDLSDFIEFAKIGGKTPRLFVEKKPEKKRCKTMRNLNKEFKKKYKNLNKEIKNDFHCDMVENPLPMVNKTNVSDNQGIIKTWTLKNTGPKPLPANLNLIYRGRKNNEMVTTEKFSIGNKEINVGDTFKVYACIKTPSNYGRYKSNWRVCTENGIVFGQKLPFHLILTPEKKEADCLCICGMPLLKTTIEDAYDKDVNESKVEVYCDECSSQITFHKCIYHCPKDKFDAKHPHGYDVCEFCVVKNSEKKNHKKENKKMEEKVAEKEVVDNKVIEKVAEKVEELVVPKKVPKKVESKKVVDQMVQKIPSKEHKKVAKKEKYQYEKELKQLLAMGLGNEVSLKTLLNKYKGNIQNVLFEVFQ